MNIVKKIILVNRITKKIEKAKKIIDNHSQLAQDVQKILFQIKSDCESLIALLPSLKDVVNDIKVLLDVK